MCFSHSFWLAAVSEAVMIANVALAARGCGAAWSISVSAMPSGVAWFTKKSRASGSASASQVTTLMPRAAGLAQHRGDALAVLDATAITSTPRVIQVSTTSFCLAGSVSVGPSQSSLTPSSRAASSAPLRQPTK